MATNETSLAKSIDMCRGHIINSLLSGLPKINELLKMSEVNNDE